MRKNPIVAAILLIILLSLGYAVKHCFFPEVPPIESPITEPITVQPPSSEEVPRSAQEAKPIGPPYNKKVFEGMSIGQQRGLTDEIVTSDDKSTDLSNHSMSIKREEKKSFEIMPGVKVKSGAVHVQLDEENNKSLEIERHPRTSNSDYQVMIKKKF